MIFLVRRIISWELFSYKYLFLGNKMCLFLAQITCSHMHLTASDCYWPIRFTFFLNNSISALASVQCISYLAIEVKGSLGMKRYETITLCFTWNRKILRKSSAISQRILRFWRFFYFLKRNIDRSAVADFHISNLIYYFTMAWQAIVVLGMTALAAVVGLLYNKKNFRFHGTYKKSRMATPGEDGLQALAVLGILVGEIILLNNDESRLYQLQWQVLRRLRLIFRSLNNYK